jgi:hypothetical protein
LAIHTTAMVAPMIEKSAESSGVAALKWLCRPRTTCQITTLSITLVATTRVPSR